MRSRRLRWQLLLPAALVLLLATLGTLQYRWLTQVSNADHERRRNWLAQRAQEMADDFDREVMRVYVEMQSSADAVQRQDWEAFAVRYAAWRDAARYPELVRAIYLAHATRPTDDLRRFNADRHTFEAAPWPDTLAPVLATLRPAAPTPGPAQPADAMRTGVEARFLAGGRETIVPAIPALVVPLPVFTSVTLPDPASANMLFRAGPGPLEDFLIVELDRGYLRDTMLPSLVDRHFPGSEGTQYRFAVVDTAQPQTPVFTRGLADNATLDPAKADATASMLMPRMELASQFVRAIARQPSSASGAADRDPAGGGAAAARQVTGVFQYGPVPPPPPPMASRSSTMSIVVQSAGADVVKVTRWTGPWRLAIQHTAGSLDAAVEQARRRNLWLSFSILGVLAAGVGLIVVNAQRSQRLAAQQMDFVATVTHELRTPLTVIRSAAQNLSAGVISDPTQARRYGDLIESEGRRLTDMVEQVLEFAGLSGGRGPASARPLDPAELVRDVLASSDAMFQADHFTVDQTIEAVPLVVADDAALRRALNNLLANAIKYAESGRWIGVTVRAGVHAGRDEVQIAVSDRGRGIDPEDADHIFDPFYRGRYAVERQIHGNGLGLSLVKRIAEAHGGRVTLQSPPGEGATFTIHLPAAAGEPAPAPQGAPAGATR
jgi:signal transduction histidine kinase